RLLTLGSCFQQIATHHHATSFLSRSANRRSISPRVPVSRLRDLSYLIERKPFHRRGSIRAILGPIQFSVPQLATTRKRAIIDGGDVLCARRRQKWRIGSGRKKRTGVTSTCGQFSIGG